MLRIRGWAVSFTDSPGDLFGAADRAEDLNEVVSGNLTDATLHGSAHAVLRLGPSESRVTVVVPLRHYVRQRCGKAGGAEVVRWIAADAVVRSEFGTVPNERGAPRAAMTVGRLLRLGRAHRVARAFGHRSHPNVRHAKQLLIILRLARVIAERKVQGGLRRALLVQSQRLEWLARRRYEALGGAASVETEGDADA